MKQKKAPMRKCVGCGEQKSKKELIRIVKNNEDEIFVDDTSKANGRGVYICNNVDCFEKAHANKQLERSLKCRINEDLYDELKTKIDK